MPRRSVADAAEALCCVVTNGLEVGRSLFCCINAVCIRRIHLDGGATCTHRFPPALLLVQQGSCVQVSLHVVIACCPRFCAMQYNSIQDMLQSGRRR